MGQQPQKPKPFKPSKKKPRPLAPRTSCRDCGVTMRSWRKAPLCRGCTKKVMEEHETGESLRDFRKRLND